jgi:hypothetical protein
MKATGTLFVLFLAVVTAASTLTSCEDKTGPCGAVVTVTDSLGKRISGAIVTLRPDSSVYGPGSPQVDTSVTQTAVTDVVGQATFSYKLEAVLIIDASKGVKSGRDYIRLEAAKTVSKSIVIR